MRPAATGHEKRAPAALLLLAGLETASDGIALTTQGLGRDRISPAGADEMRPIAPNTDESGRALNRRVEVHCK